MSEDRQKRELSIMQLIDEEEIEAQRTSNGGWNRTQLAQWGVPWPPPAGWKSVILNHGIPYNAALNTKTKERQKPESAARPVICRNCCSPMTEGTSAYFCERCGLTWKNRDTKAAWD
jgi:hypothetical protein